MADPVVTLKKFFLLRIFGKKYTRHGKCLGCGRCCKEIYIKHQKGVITDEKEFNRLKRLHWFYGYLNIVDKTEHGLVFECSKLDKETNRCTIYNRRSLICRSYPQEELFMLGGEIGEECGYRFTPIESFEKVLESIKGK